MSERRLKAQYIPPLRRRFLSQPQDVFAFGGPAAQQDPSTEQADELLFDDDDFARWLAEAQQDDDAGGAGEATHMEVDVGGGGASADGGEAAADDAEPSRHHLQNGEAPRVDNAVEGFPAGLMVGRGMSAQAAHGDSAAGAEAAAVGERAAAAAGAAAPGDESDDDEVDADAIAHARAMIAAGDANASAAGRPQETLSLAGEGQQQHQAGDAAACAAAEQHAETAQTAGVAHARREPHEQPSAAEPDPGPLLGAQGEGPGTSGAAAAAAAAGEDPPGLGAAASSGAALVVAGDLDASEVVLRVQVCKPKGDPRRSQEFLVLGSQLLTELRDRVICTTDSVARTYLPDQPAPGAFFFVEGTFYNDMRDPDAADLSEPLRTFPYPLLVAGQAPAAEPLPDAGQLRITFEGDGVAAAAADGDAVGPFDGEERGAAAAAAGPSGRFSAANMEDTTFEQLSIRLAAPYCFCHQGTCEHIFVFTELRRIRPADPQFRAAYPVQTIWDRPRLKVCGICQVSAAQKTVLRSRLAPTSPCFFCGECFQRLHYNAQGHLLFSDFEVYDHIENTL